MSWILRYCYGYYVIFIYAIMKNYVLLIWIPLLLWILCYCYLCYYEKFCVVAVATFCRPHSLVAFYSFQHHMHIRHTPRRDYGEQSAVVVV